MPYSTIYKEERYVSIEKHLRVLDKLPEDKSLILHYENIREADRIRWLFHDYFHLMGTTGNFIIKQIGNYIFLGKKTPTLKSAISLEKKDIAKEFDDIIKNLLSLPFPRKYLAALMENEEISFASLGAILMEYSRIMGE